MLELDRINSLIEILQVAKTVGYSIKTSPIVPLLEVLIDLSLKLSNEFQKQGIFWEGKKNPSIKFLDFADSLGNPKSIKIWESRHISESPQLARYFRKLALDLTGIKNLQDLPKDLYSYDKSRDGPTQKIKPESYHFFRRSRFRKKK